MFNFFKKKGVDNGDSFNQMLAEFEEILKTGNRNAISSEVSKFLKFMETLPERLQEERAIEVAKLIDKYGRLSYEKSDIFSLTGREINLGFIYDKYPESKVIALLFLGLLRGVLELKYESGEHDNLEIYKKDIDIISRKFPESAEIGFECSICYANLQANCAMAASTGLMPSVHFAELIVDDMESISSRFPKDRNINLVYCRSLGAVASQFQRHSNQELYKKFLNLLRNLVNERSFQVPAEIHNFLRQA